ncbi:MAG TPA: proline/glycine betaine ABC transporter ATP-binding protein, partial [Ruminococcaceae bacterium]|nr:proline/glycine betaine ABC transporter ATP-binding protein [Oscillospiraceae bacterium]
MVQFINVYKSYKNKPVLRNISLTVKSGEFMVLIGASGCGKTTLLKMINKLNSIDRGDILLDGTSVTRMNDTEMRRKIGYVVQDGGLFP